MAPQRFHVEARGRIRARRRHERFTHGHRRGDPHERELLDALAMAQRRFEYDERAHAVADELRARDARRIEECGDPVGVLADRRARGAGAPAMPGKIHRDDAVAMVCVT